MKTILINYFNTLTPLGFVYLIIGTIIGLAMTIVPVLIMAVYTSKLKKANTEIKNELYDLEKSICNNEMIFESFDAVEQAEYFLNDAQNSN